MARSVTTWYCENCNTNYQTEEDALKCEKKHITLDKRKKFLDKLIFPLIDETLSILDDKSIDELSQTLNIYTGSLQRDVLSKCESPIEMMMAINLYIYKIVRGELEIHPQKEIKTDKSLYRVDFLIQEIGLTPLSHTYDIKIVVECDGHDFHEKTKDQAQRDKERDRVLQSLGYHVMRFTGSEIYKDAFSCAGEVINLIISHIKRIDNKHTNQEIMKGENNNSDIDEKLVEYVSKENQKND